MGKNLPILNFPNEGNDLVFETDAGNEHWSAVLKIEEGEKLCKYCSGSLIRQNVIIPRWKKILAVIWGIEKFLIFLAPKSFIIRTDCK